MEIILILELKIYKKNIIKYLKSGGIPIVAGFQGINSHSRIELLIGRGGTDASAIMLARFFKARKMYNLYRC